MPMTKEDIFKKLSAVKNLPTLPVVMEKLQKAMRDPHSDVARISRIIQDDPSMMARILKVVNSALYGARDPITSLQLAIARMGLNAINNIAMSTSVFATFSKAKQSDFNREEFWRHCISTGIAVNVLYNRCRANLGRTIEKDLLHLAGLLHDIGKIIFETYFHAEFMQSIQLCREQHVPLFQIELETIGADHAQVGAWLGERWNLAPAIIETVRWHHEPDNADEELRDLAMLTHAANYICNLVKVGDSGDAVAPAFFRGVWKRLGINVDDMSAIMDQVKEESKQSEVLLAFV
jgi:putative nucleotidyltransferase with HDIG domain